MYWWIEERIDKGCERSLVLDRKVNDKKFKNTKIRGNHDQSFKLGKSKNKDKFVKKY